MFDLEKPSLEDQVQDRKRCIEEFDSRVMKFAFGPCTAKARSNALKLQRQNRRHYEFLCEIEDALREVQDVLDDSRLVSLEQNGLLALLRMNRFPEVGEADS